MIYFNEGFFRSATSFVARLTKATFTDLATKLVALLITPQHPN
ncbi:MAG: hypothetical protein ACPG19_07760 [Saprospiraceae bacterium]